MQIENAQSEILVASQSLRGRFAVAIIYVGLWATVFWIGALCILALRFLIAV